MTALTALEQAIPTFTGRETTEERLTALESALQELLDTLRYALQNLSPENFNANALARLIEPINLRIADAAGDVAALAVTADALDTRLTNAEQDAAALTLTANRLSARVTNAEGSASELSQTAKSLDARVAGAEGSLAPLSARVSNDEARIALVADGNGVNAASIVAAINNAGSSVTLSADKIHLDGITTVADTLSVGRASDFGTRKTIVFHSQGARITGWYDNVPSLMLSAAKLHLNGEVLVNDVSLEKRLSALEARVAALGG